MLHRLKKFGSIFLMFLLLTSMNPLTPSAAPLFKDVKTGHWAAPSIEWAAAEGLTSGYPDGTFAPERPITEAQFVSLLVAFDCSSPKSFAANPGEHKASGNYRYLQQRQIPLNGYYNTYFRDQPVKKGQAARIIAAYRGFDLSEAEAVQFLYRNDLANGATGKNDYQDYSPKLDMTRAEAVFLLHRLSKQGSCEITGLSKRPNGSDNSKNPTPPNFKDDDTVVFQPKPGKPSATLPNGPANGQYVEVDVEKKTLIANGVDSTFITLSLLDCNGNPIAYEDSSPFKVTSERGAKLDNSYFGHTEYTSVYNSADEHRLIEAQAIASKAWEDVQAARLTGSISLVNEKIRIAQAADAEVAAIRARLDRTGSYVTYRTSTTTSSDGPEVTVKVTAPAVKVAQTDTISFHLTNSNQTNMTCYSKPVTVELEYVPQLELRMKYEEVRTQGSPYFIVTATLARPGNEIIRSFDGAVKLQSMEGANLPSEVRFSNGVARFTVNPFNSTRTVRDLITAEIITDSSHYRSEIAPLLNKKHSLELVYDPQLRNDASCSANDVEVAFILDASGSMKRNDPRDHRISKSKELIEAILAPKNIGTKFNSRGTHLMKWDRTSVKNSFNSVGHSGGTNIADGLNKAFNEFDPPNGNRKFAILLTDGHSNEQRVINQIAEVKKKEIKVFTIGLGKNVNHKLLQKLADETGGYYFHINDSSEIAIAYQSILAAITCGTPPPTCGASDLAFSSPSITRTGSEVLMFTEVREGCGEIAKVVVRFHSNHGTVDYQLYGRGQDIFRLDKPIREITNFDLYTEGEFLAFDRTGKLVGVRKVPISYE
ncbi:S-layer homology domain-containing protein [Sporosarcina sp. 179-K 3D1 HS]|uniref:S-layer homology domain-containing protein n=1 Tax=Sporosarcina sp. 179-K 3D1 HS TaxID=3232169 RepID=UPI00399FB01F